MNFKNILAIESAVGDGSISLLREGGVEDAVCRVGASRAEKIIVEIDELLGKASISKQTLDLIAVSVGPGSYSGIRIGVSTALGLGNAIGIPVTGVSALEALAGSVAADRVVAVVPVGKNDFAWQMFDSDKDGTKRPIGKPALDSITTPADSLSIDRDVSIIAPSDCLERIKGLTGGNRTFIDAGNCLAFAIARLAFAKGGTISDPKAIYMRSAVARSSNS